MLRVLIFPSLCLLIVFTGIGVLLSRQWGWSEYASPQLYLIYQEALNQSQPYFLVDAQGSGQRWKLTSPAASLTTLNCSPDGRTLAYLTDSGHLYVIDQAGALYDRQVGQGYDAITTANDGKVALTQRDYGIRLVVDSSDSSLPVPPDHLAYDSIDIASSGVSLWPHTALGGIKLVTPSGQTLMTVAAGAFSPIWLASEQVFAFSYIDQEASLDGGLVDASDQEIVRFRNGLLRYGILSPDATVEALPIQSSATNTMQIAIVDPLSGAIRQQFGNDAWVDHMPICFLTFRPQNLIGGSVSS